MAERSGASGAGGVHKDCCVICRLGFEGSVKKKVSCAASFLSSVEWRNVAPEVFEAEGWSSGSKSLSNQQSPYSGNCESQPGSRNGTGRAKEETWSLQKVTRTVS